MILGHLIPAGTGFRTHQDAEVRLQHPQTSFRSHGRDGDPDGSADEAAVMETAGK